MECRGKRTLYLVGLARVRRYGANLQGNLARFQGSFGHPMFGLRSLHIDIQGSRRPWRMMALFHGYLGSYSV